MKKFLSTILAMVMLIAAVQNIFCVSVFAENVVSADANGVFWIEESDYDTYSNSADGTVLGRVGTSGTTQETADSMSGGDAHWAWWGGTTYSSTYKVNVPEAGTYKLWYRGSDPTNGYSDTLNIKVNGEEVTVSKVSGTDFSVTIDPAGTKKNFACGWFTAEVFLSTGENTIAYEILEKSTSGQKYAGLLDCTVIAPANFEWEEPSIDSRPTGSLVSNVIEFDEDGVAKIEESDYDTYSNSADGTVLGRVGTNGTTQETADSMSGGDAHWAWWGGVTYSSTYKVNVQEAGMYKLWYRGSDPTNGYSDTLKIKVNGEEITVSKISGTDFTVTIDPTGTKKNFACGWFIADVFLANDVNVISYEILEKSTSGQKYAGLFDCMLIAPASFVWEEPSIDSKPTGSLVSNVIEFDEDGTAWIEESDYDSYSNADGGTILERVGTNGTSQELADSMSGGDAHWAWWSGVTYSSIYKVNVSEAGTYKLWYRGSDPTNGYSDTLKVMVNGTETAVSKVPYTDFEATIDPEGTKKKFACGWFLAEVEFTSGVNVIAYEIMEKSTSGQKYAGLFDCMVIAPVSFSWDKPSIGTKPTEGNILEFNEDCVLKLEESDYDTYSNSTDGVLSTRVGVNGTTQETADAMSGGDAYWAWWGGTTYSATYKVNAPKAGTYKLWYRGSDPEGPYHDKSVIKINGAETAVTKVVGSDFTATIDPEGTKKNFASGWFLAEVTLTSGVNVISYEVSELSTSGQKYACLFDCLVLAPAEYVWKNPTIDTLPVADAGTGEDPDKPLDPDPTPGTGKVIEFNEDKVAKFEESDYDTYSNAADGVLSTRVGVNGTTQETADSMSGGDAYWAYWGGTTFSATYKVNVPEDGTYKLWYRGSDPTNGYFDKSVIKVNGVETAVTKVPYTDFVAEIDPEGTKKNFAGGWFVAEVTLTSGVNEISYEVSEKSSSVDKYACLLDCMVLSPAEYVWEEPTIDTLPGVEVVPDYTSGDANGDDEVDVKDVIAIRRHITGGYSVTINEAASNVNGDDKIDVKDAIVIRRYIAGGYGVELK